MNTHLHHTKSERHKQKHLLMKFNEQLKKDFEQDGPNINVLRAVYGNESPVVQHALTKHNKNLHASQKDSFSIFKNSSSVEYENSKLSDIENTYWDVANNVLLDPRSWINLPTSMKRFHDM